MASFSTDSISNLRITLDLGNAVAGDSDRSGMISAYLDAEPVHTAYDVRRKVNIVLSHLNLSHRFDPPIDARGRV